MSATYEIFNENGDATSYKKVSARLPEFLKTYSPEKGYCIVGEVTDLLGIQHGKLASLQDGHTQQSQDDTVCLIFTRKLLSKEGKVLATASALKHIREYKDYETGETAALQRLLALLGFGGECFDDDETNDFNAQDLTFSVKKAEPAKPSSNRAKAKPKPKPEEATVTSITPNSPAPEKQPSAHAKKADDSSIPLALARQLAHQAKLKGVTTNPCSTKEDAKKELKRLKEL